ncbi:MAG: HAMP domain-containing sensor histidine kinase [Nocardioides sp.]
MRTRITLAVGLLVALALTGSGAIVYLIEMERNREQAMEEVNQEVDEFATLQTSGIDPATGERFAGVVPLLETFLDRNVPSPTEDFLAWFDGEPLPGQDVLAEDPELRAIVADLTANNGDRLWDSPDRGEVLIAVQTVRYADDPRLGALVVVQDIDERDDLLLETMRTYAIVALLSLVLVLAIAGWQSGRLLAPLRTLRETADLITETDLSRRIPESGNDDISALTRTVNGMLSRLEAAFVDQREFLDDAGHELRTPLTVLRGHLELLDSGSPDEVAETQALLLDEVDRMARLVGDLILLAKRDRPDFLKLSQVHLSVLTEDLVAKARGLGDRDWVLDGAPRHAVEMDEQRITQAVLQLADNAVKHTGPGDEIGIGSSYDGTHAQVWVRDTGPGIPTSDRALIFERFGRSSVPEHDEGFGLGLSIVAAIVDAHAGSVEVLDAEPHGAKIVLTLPALQADRQSDRQSERESDTWPAS